MTKLHSQPTARSQPSGSSTGWLSWTGSPLGWLIAVMVLVALGVVGFAGVVLHRHYSPRYWSADDLGPIRVNTAGPPGAAPEGMVWVPGGTFWMGSDKFPDARPIHKVYVDGFWMD